MIEKTLSSGDEISAKIDISQITLEYLDQISNNQEVLQQIIAELKKIQAGSEWNRETHYPLLQKAESLLGSMGISEEVRQNYPDLMNLNEAELNDELNRLYRGQSNGTIDNQPWDAVIHGTRLKAAQEIRKNKFGQ